MDWNELKDWKVVGWLITGVIAIIAWWKKQPKEDADIIQARAQARKLNRETEVSENTEINQLRSELNQIREQLRLALITVDKLKARLTVYETFKASLKK